MSITVVGLKAQMKACIHGTTANAHPAAHVADGYGTVSDVLA